MHRHRNGEKGNWPIFYFFHFHSKIYLQSYAHDMRYVSDSDKEKTEWKTFKINSQIINFE